MEKSTNGNIKFQGLSIQELLKVKRNLMDELTRTIQSQIDMLVSIAPQELQTYISKSIILSNIYGSYDGTTPLKSFTGKIKPFEINDYGFESVNQMYLSLLNLKEVWKDHIEFNVSLDESYGNDGLITISYIVILS